ncbi:hypothetical protein ACVK00_002518 [Burkholderia sp. PvR073]
MKPATAPAPIAMQVELNGSWPAEISGAATVARPSPGRPIPRY